MKAENVPERKTHINIDNPVELLGNNYNEDAIRQWYEDEERFHDRFADGLPGKSWVIYRVFDEGYAFKEFFHPRRESRVLDFGCAEGCDIELLRLRHEFRLFGIDASDTQLRRFQKKYPGSEVKKATVSGRIDYDSDFFEYIIELSTLHHIPNVSFVLSELARVLKPGGTMILREPISYMRPVGQEPPKQGISPHERGIPVRFMLLEFNRLGLEPISVRHSFATPTMLAVAKLPALEKVPWLIFRADKILSLALKSNTHYYRRTLLDKIAPGAAYYVVRKQQARSPTPSAKESH